MNFKSRIYSYTSYGLNPEKALTSNVQVVFGIFKSIHTPTFHAVIQPLKFIRIQPPSTQTLLYMFKSEIKTELFLRYFNS